MSLFRKQTPTSPVPVPAEPDLSPAPPAPTPAPSPPIVGSAVDFGSVYQLGHVSADERDRVHRAEKLLEALPDKASHKKEVVDVTLKAFGVDALKILEAANKQQRALEAFIRASQEQAQRVLDQGEQRIADLEAEIARVRQVKAQASSEQEERARLVNAELDKVQQVLDFFGQQVIEEIDAPDPDEPTEVGPSKRLGRTQKPSNPTV